jgi:hypothetical protein
MQWFTDLGVRTRFPGFSNVFHHLLFPIKNLHLRYSVIAAGISYQDTEHRSGLPDYLN